MPADPTIAAEVPAACADVRAEAGRLIVAVGGTWNLQARVPAADEVTGGTAAAEASAVAVEARDLGAWDSSLVLFILSLRAWAAARGMAFDSGDLPAAVSALVAQFDAAEAVPAPSPPKRLLLTTRLGLRTTRQVGEVRRMLGFLGECVYGTGRVLARPLQFRWGDCVEQMRRNGAAALPIVGLISMLVGVILSFVAAVQLRQFGADIFVANLVGLAVCREMGPMMAAVVLTGRTGAAFAAELGNMKLGEEIDALETFGVRPHDFLVMPRLVALVLMMPLLALYADFLGVAGGLLIADTMLDIAPQAFFAQLQGALSMSDVLTGLLKSFFFGLIVAYSGCFRGMQAERSSVGVGQATTSAVVMGILLVIVADSIFTVVFDVLGW